MNYLLRSRQHPGLQLEIGDSLLTVGRAADNALTIDDPTVSRHHAVIQIEVGLVNLTDLGSTSGTFVNGERIQRVSIRVGDVIRFGDSEWQLESVASKITVHSGEATATPTPTIQPVATVESNAPTVPSSSPIYESRVAELERPSTTTAILPPATQPRLGRLRRLVIGVSLLTVIVVLTFFVVGLLAPDDRPMSQSAIPLAMPEPGPLIVLETRLDAGGANIGQPATVFVSAYDEVGVQRIELWVDGDLTDAYESSLPGGSNPLAQSLVWQPSASGASSVLVRAYDVNGDVSLSNIIPVVVAPAAYQVQPGDTWETIADVTGFDVGGLQSTNINQLPAVGTDLILPTMDGIEGYVVEEGETLDDIAQTLGTTRQEILETNPTILGDGILSPGSLINVPIDAGLGGSEVAQVVDVPPTGGLLPPVEGFQSLTTENCGEVKLIWGKLANAQGYTIYGVKPGTTALSPMEESSAEAISTLWILNAPGTWEFYIAGVDAGGKEGALAKTTFATIDCDSAQSALATIRLTSLDIQTTAAVQQLYAYVRLGGSANRYQRIPAQVDQFLRRSADGHFRAENFPDIDWPRTGSMPIEVEVWGWAGRQLVSLGVLQTTLEVEKALQDRQAVLKTSDVYATITFDIVGEPVSEAGTELAFDTRLPPPGSVQFLSSQTQCLAVAASHSAIRSYLRSLCGLTDISWQNFTVWQWPPAGYSGSATESDLSGFQFEYSLMDAVGHTVSTEYIEVTTPLARGWLTYHAIRAAALPCNLRANLSIRAVGQRGNYSDWAFVSDFLPPRACETEVKLVFDQLEVLKADDGYGDSKLEGYGYLQVGNHSWEPELCSGKPCSWQPIRRNTYDWRTLEKLWRETARQEIPVRLSDRESLTISVRIMDWDANSGNDELCEASFTLPPRTLSDWQSYVLNQPQFVLNSSNCRIVGRFVGSPQAIDASSAETNLGAIAATVNGCGSQEGGPIDPPNLWFGAACAAHDKCYFSELSGKSKEQCDDDFLSDMRASCQLTGGAQDVINACLYAAEVYYSAVVIGGGGSYVGDTSVLNCLDSNSPVRCTAGYAVPVLGQAADGVTTVGQAGVQLGEDAVDVTVAGAQAVGNGVAAGAEAVGNVAEDIWCSGWWC